MIETEQTGEEATQESLLTVFTEKAGEAREPDQGRNGELLFRP